MSVDVCSVRVLLNDWFLQYFSHQVWNDFKENDKVNRDLIEGILSLPCQNDSEKAKHANLMAALCRIMDGEDYETRYDPERDFSVLEECLKSVEFLERSVQCPVADVYVEMKNKIEEQAVFVCCRDANFEAAETVFKRLFGSSDGKTLKDNKRKAFAERILKVIKSEDQDHTELKSHSYSLFIVDMKKCFEVIYDTFNVPMLYRIAKIWQEKQNATSMEMDVTTEYINQTNNNNNNSTVAGETQSATIDLYVLNDAAKELGMQKEHSKFNLEGKERDRFQSKLKKIREKTCNSMIEKSVLSIMDVDNECSRLQDDTTMQTLVSSTGNTPVKSRNERVPKVPSSRKNDSQVRKKYRRLRIFDENSDSSSESNDRYYSKEQGSKRSRKMKNRNSKLSSPASSHNNSPKKQLLNSSQLTPRNSKSSSPSTSHNNSPNKQLRNSPRLSPRGKNPYSKYKHGYRKNMHREDRHIPVNNLSPDEQVEEDSLFFNPVKKVQRKHQHSTPIRSSFFKSVRRTKWTQNEEELFYKNVLKYGVGQWAIIKKKMDSFRSNVDLKDKWRQFKKSGKLYELEDMFGAVQFE